MSDKLIIHATDTSTENPILPFESMVESMVATCATADVAVRCIICDEYIPMNSCDYRTREVFICDKCKAAIKHVRDILENGGSVV